MRQFIKTVVPTEGYTEIKQVGTKYVVHLEGVNHPDDGSTTCYECITDSTPDMEQLRADLEEYKAYTAGKELESVKCQKVKDLLAYDASYAVNGFIIRTQDGDFTEWLDPYKRNNAFRAIESAKKLGDESISFAIGDIPLTLTVTTAEIYLARVEKYAVTCTNVTASHKAAINALDSVEAVEAYDFTVGYPERLTFSVEELS